LDDPAWTDWALTTANTTTARHARIRNCASCEVKMLSLLMKV
jgi:hypothetical protein